MVYQIPVWKLKFFLPWGSQEQKNNYFFGPQSKKHYLWWDTPYLHIKPNPYECRKVQRFQVFKWNWIILIHSSYIAFLVIWTPPGSEGEQVGGVSGGMGGASTCIPTHIHMQLS